MPHKNPHYYRDYFRARAEVRRAYQKERYRQNPQAQRTASDKYRAKMKALKPPKSAPLGAACPSRSKARIAERNLKYKLQRHGVDQTWYMAQPKCCAICGTDKPGGRGRFHIDHNHETGDARGLLCIRCNQALGLFGDNPETLISASEYLLWHGFRLPTAHATAEPVRCP